MVGFLFYSELGQHGRLSILFGTWAALSAFYLQVGQHGQAFYSELGQHGLLSIYKLDSMVGFIF